MKNLLKIAACLFVSVSLFSCQESVDPQPESGSTTRSMAEMSSAPVVTTTAMQGNPITDRQPISTLFGWQLMKTVTLPYQKGLNLSSPFSIVDETAGDISWGSDGGCYSAIKCQKVTQAILKIVEVKTVTPEYLKTLTFKKGQAAWAPEGSTSWTNYMPVGTVIAYKTTNGAFRLVVVKSTSPLVLDIYHGLYYQKY